MFQVRLHFGMDSDRKLRSTMRDVPKEQELGCSPAVIRRRYARSRRHWSRSATRP
jgi:hypothetical protein